MTYPTPINLVSVVVAVLYQHASWPKVGVAADPIWLFGGELPPGWTLRKSVLALSDGGPDSGFVANVDRVTFWCYGATEIAASEVADKLEEILLQTHNNSATIGAETVRIWAAQKVSGPTYLPIDLNTATWPRYVVSYIIDRNRHGT